MFFDESRQHFFRPLISKYKEHVAECLRQLYTLQFSSTRIAYGQSLTKNELIEIFQETLATCNIGFELDNEGDVRFRDEKELAGWILTSLVEAGWIERQVDEATLKSTFAFSRYGRLFTEPFVQTDRSSRTRQRNTRNTHNALRAFVESGDVYDLIDAWEFSERIVSDFTDVIAEIDERRRDLVKEAESKIMEQHASEQFFEFMEKRFHSDLSVRLTADSVEKFRDKISALIRKLRARENEFKAHSERRLRELLPELVQDGHSVMFDILDTIDMRISNASEAMLPEVRRALQGFTKRADIIIRQLSYIASQQHNNMIDVCNQLANLPENEQNNRLALAGFGMSHLNLGFVDPQANRLKEKSKRLHFDSMIDDETYVDEGARKEIFIQQVLDTAFFVNDMAVRSYLIENLMTQNKVFTSKLPVASASDLLSLTHAIEVGSASGLSSEYEFLVQYTGKRCTSQYLIEHDEFSIELITKDAQSMDKEETTA